MIGTYESVKNALKSPVRNITAKVELYNGSTLVDTFNYNDKLMNFTVERVGEGSKFFGFGICQHAKITILDVNREVDYITTDYSFKIKYGVAGYDIQAHPTFYITQTRRDENTNTLTFYGYDLLYPAATHTTAELTLPEAPTILQYMVACFELLGAVSPHLVYGIGLDDDVFKTQYPEGANFEGTETIREMMDDIAEATQTIYYVNHQDKICWKRLGGPTTTSYLELTKDNYFTLETKDGRRLQSICSATQLGENIIASATEIGSTQYVRDNGFWELRDDIATLVENAVAAVGGLSIRQFDCSWRGYILVEPGDTLHITTKDNQTVISYLLDDVIEYNGTLSQKTKWSYTDNESESLNNPTSIGDALKMTYAKVDKVNKEIELVVSEVNGEIDKITTETSSLRLTTDAIQASVQQLDNEVAGVVSSVNAKVSAEDVEISIQKAMEQGVNSITTTTGFTFNEEGLHVSKTGSDITTTITEDGMTVLRKDEAVLIADNLGVRAEDLHATTFLIIGNNSRLEDYDTNRTGCFWIGN